MNAEQAIIKLQEIGLEYGPKLLGAILVWIIGGMVVRGLKRGLSSMLDRRGTDPTLKPFLLGLAGTLLRVLLIITVLSMLGVAMTSFVAIIGAIGLAVGMALSGSLSNFAGGVMLLLFKPFEKGHFIEAQGYMGTVNEIQIFNTILKTPDNKTIIIPNGPLSTGPMVNFSREEKRRVDFTFGIGYGDDYTKAREVLMGLIKADSRIINDPAEPFIALSELADSSVNIVVRVWAKGSDYWGIYFDMHHKVYEAFAKEGLNIPFPQMDVHVHQQN